MRTMSGSDMEISVGNKQLHENKHAQRHSQSSEHITVIMKTRATNADPSSLRFGKRVLLGWSRDPPGARRRLCVRARTRVCVPFETHEFHLT